MIKTAASLNMLSKEKRIKFHVMNITQQLNGVSCGVYSLAFAAGLCLKIESSSLVFSHKLMYNNLKRCLERGKMGLIGVVGKMMSEHLLRRSISVISYI